MSIRRSSRLDPPPPGDLIDWPATFGTRFIVFCDVEEEFNWRGAFTRSAHSTAAMRAFPDAHRRFADLGMPLVCMVDYPIASDPSAVDTLRQVIADERSAIGAQLHPWVTPPFDEPLTPTNSYLGNLPIELQAAKIDALTAALTRAFGRQPLAFRAGRYGIGPCTRRLLADRGYRLDCSVRARYDYRVDGGPDFRRFGNAAHRVDGLVELPFSTVFTGRLGQAAAPAYRLASSIPHGPGVLARSGLVNRVSLTPEGMPVAEAIEAVDTALAGGERLLSFAFHSPSLVPGNTPYVRTPDDLEQFWRWWAAMAAHLGKRGVEPITLGDLLAQLRSDETSPGQAPQSR